MDSKKNEEDVVTLRRIYGNATTRKAFLELERLKFVADDYVKIKEMIDDGKRNRS